MKTIMAVLIAACIFILGCWEQEPAPKGQITTEINKAAVEINKQIDVLSADLKGTSAVLQKEMPGIVMKVQELLAELQILGQEMEKSLASLEPQTAEQPQGVSPKTIEALLGANAVITLEANHTTGYSWQSAKPLETDIIKFIGTQYITTETGLIGAGGKEVWTFKTLKKGIVEVPLVYVRPWEKDKSPARQATFMIIVK